MFKDKKNIIRLIFLILPFVLAVLFYIFYSRILAVVASLPVCIFNRIGLLCPGCGNTRAVIAIAHGHLVESIFYNPSMLILLIFFVLFYIEQACALFGKKIKLVPRKAWFYIVLAVLLTLYFVLRNVPAFSWLTWIKV